MWTFETFDTVLSWAVLPGPQHWWSPFQRFGMKLKSEVVALPFDVSHKKTLKLLETRPQSSWMWSFETFDIFLGWEVSVGVTAIEAPFSAFWDGTKKRSLGHHYSTFVCKKILTLLETRPPSSLMWTFETFDTVLSWAVSSGGHSGWSLFQHFGTKLKSEVVASPFDISHKKTLTLLERRPQSSWMWSFETFDIVLSWKASVWTTAIEAPFSTFWDGTKKRSLGHHCSTFVCKKKL